MSIRLEDCTPDQRRLLLALIALEKSEPVKRTADARKAPTVLGVDRVADDHPRRRAA